MISNYLSMLFGWCCFQNTLKLMSNVKVQKILMEIEVGNIKCFIAKHMSELELPRCEKKCKGML